MEPENSDFTMVSSMTPQIDTQQIVTSSTQVDDDDHERFTHIVLEGYTPKDGEFVALDNSVVGAMINATPVMALCGKVWVPGRDPQKFRSVQRVRRSRSPWGGRCRRVSRRTTCRLP